MVQASLSQSKVEASKAIQEASGSDDPAYVKTSIVTQVELLYGLKCDLQNALVLQEENKCLFDLKKINVDRIASFTYKTEKICEELIYLKRLTIRSLMDAGMSFDDAVDEFYDCYNISYAAVLEEISNIQKSYLNQLAKSQYKIFSGILNSMRNGSYQFEKMDSEYVELDVELFCFRKCVPLQYCPVLPLTMF